VAVEVHEITSREQWLELRKPFITASVVAACPAFRAHEWISPLRLYAEKRGVEFPDDPDNKVLRRGRWLEPAVRRACEELHPEWKIVAPKKFYCDPECHIGATPDYFVESGDPRGRINLQIKTVSDSVYKRLWNSGTDIPLYVTLQAATEAMLSECAASIVAVMLVDPHNMDVALLDVPRHPAAEIKIVNEVKRFWNDIRKGIEPDVDFARDGAVLKLLLPREVPGSVLDLTGNNEIPDLLARRAAMMAEMKIMEQRCKIIQTKLMALMGDNASITGIDGWNVSFKIEPRKAYSVAASEPRVLRIRDKRPDDQRPAGSDED
jgi:hypothetical protein